MVGLPGKKQYRHGAATGDHPVEFYIRHAELLAAYQYGGNQQNLKVRHFDRTGKGFHRRCAADAGYVLQPERRDRVSATLVQSERLYRKDGTDLL